MNEIRQMNRIASLYERKFRTDDSNIRARIGFHVEQLELAINYAKKALEENSVEIENWANTIQVVNEVDDANTWLQKLELKIMVWFVNYKYDKAIKYSYNMNAAIERLEKILARLKSIQFFCH